MAGIIWNKLTRKNIIEEKWIHTLRSVVIASVAILLLESVIRFSSSRLHDDTTDGCFIATYKGR